MSYQWTIFHADLDPTVGHEQAGERPVLVVPAEPLNEHYAVVMTAPITSRKADRPARLGEVFLARGTGGLRADSFALCYQVRTLDKSRLVRAYGAVINPESQEDVRFMLAMCLDLSP